MEGIMNLLSWINENWASLVTVIVIVLVILSKARTFYFDWKNKTEEEKQEELNKAIKHGFRDISSLAEYFNVTEDFISKALKLYKQIETN